MVNLESKVLLEQFIDLQSLKMTERQRRYSKWVLPSSVSILMILFWLSIVAGLLMSKNVDSSKIPLSLCAIVGYPMVIFIHWHLVIKYDRFCDLFNDMAAIATDCKSTIFILSQSFS